MSLCYNYLLFGAFIFQFSCAAILAKILGCRRKTSVGVEIYAFVPNIVGKWCAHLAAQEWNGSIVSENFNPNDGIGGRSSIIREWLRLDSNQTSGSTWPLWTTLFCRTKSTNFGIASSSSRIPKIWQLLHGRQASPTRTCAPCTQGAVPSGFVCRDTTL